ncbi:siderophore-interacting protein [Allonocardiopsis opalescens]|uniref:NADPH-dependent ferric siderophore reductase n=1 Tax=Allonocardiopsis opalescens TaxID=1144618 RepID=A0A2T0PZ22_9ACTN|nr:siderophore-interacting protein [Allonocardiopsis opalescens]PRX96657.1 NADPH-dependent ferric siderophore reductase [Allonocardiopsis opalescens]
MSSTNIAVKHAPGGFVTAEVLRSEQISPHLVRVTVGGDDLARYTFQGFDQWFRLAIPVGGGTRFDNLPERIDMPGYLRYLALPKGTRPVLRNYTARAYRAGARELDIDFVVHGDEGVAGPWARVARPGESVALLDQGRGYSPVPADWQLLVGDESALPAVAGILRDMPRDAVGHAVVELPDAADAQPTGAPEGMRVHWVVRPHGTPPGQTALAAAKALDRPAGEPYAFAAGESSLATGVRRWLVRDLGVDKSRVTFCGYWRQGHG